MSANFPTGRVLTGRDRAILAAVAAGRVEMSCSCEPDLFVDGLCCCDQVAARNLARRASSPRRRPCGWEAGSPPY
ncbi:MAG: hypothetical protein ACRDSE_02360 [Pseudonocardiaceae bacterium]